MEARVGIFIGQISAHDSDFEHPSSKCFLNDPVRASSLKATTDAVTPNWDNDGTDAQAAFMPKFFSDGLLFQQNKPMNLWGKTDAGDTSQEQCFHMAENDVLQLPHLIKITVPGSVPSRISNSPSPVRTRLTLDGPCVAEYTPAPRSRPPNVNALNGICPS